MNREHYAKLAAELEAMRQQEEKMPHPVNECDASCGGLMGQTSAPKPWVELSIEEKIERTRDQVKDRENELRYVYGRMSELQREVGRLHSQMIEHRHDPCDAGRVMLPASFRYRGDQNAGNCASPAPDVDPSKLYF